VDWCRASRALWLCFLITRPRTNTLSSNYRLGFVSLLALTCLAAVIGARTGGRDLISNDLPVIRIFVHIIQYHPAYFRYDVSDICVVPFIKTNYTVLVNVERRVNRPIVRKITLWESPTESRDLEDNQIGKCLKEHACNAQNFDMTELLQLAITFQRYPTPLGS